MTSRTPILDQCLAIRNLLALNDHELEQVINLKQEALEAQDDIKASYDKDISKTKEQYYGHYLLRKELQKELFDQYNIDLSYRCQFKHKLTIHEALKEIADATNNPADRERFETFTQDLYTWIGEITGLGHTPCGRCLLDAEQKGEIVNKTREELKFMQIILDHANKVIPIDSSSYSDDFLINRYNKFFDKYPQAKIYTEDSLLHAAVAEWLLDTNINNVVDSLMENTSSLTNRRESTMFDSLKRQYKERLLPFVKEEKKANNKDFVNKMDEKSLTSNNNTNE